MGGTAGESHCDQPSNSDASTKSDGSGCEEEVVSLVMILNSSVLFVKQL